MDGGGLFETGAGGSMSDRKPGADLDTQIADTRSRELRIGGDGETFREQPGPRLGTTDGPRIDAPTQVRPNDPKQTERAPGRIQIRPVPGQPPTTTTLTVEMVLDKIKQVYMTGLVRCYRKGLVGDASLSGKVSVSFTVTERGMGKLSSSHDYPVRGRGGQGVVAMDKAMRGGPLVALFPVEADAEIMLATDAGQSIRVPVADISFRSRTAGGVRVFNTAPDERVVSVALIAENGEEEP